MLWVQISAVFVSVLISLMQWGTTQVLEWQLQSPDNDLTYPSVQVIIYNVKIILLTSYVCMSTQVHDAVF